MSDASVAGGLVGLAFAVGALLTVRSMGRPRRPSRARSGHLSRLAQSAGVPDLRPVTVLAASAGLALMAALATLLITAVLIAAVIAAIVAAAVPVALLRRRATQRQRAIRDAWPTAVDALVSGVRAGLSLPEAVAELGQHGPEALRPAFSSFAREYHARGSFGEALDGLQRELADPVADRVTAALRIARDVGGSDLGRVLRTLSVMLREDARTRGEISARQSWTVSAARLAVAAPWLTLALLCTRPGAVQAYSSGLGAAVLLLAAAASVLAYRLMLRIGRLPAEPRLVSS